MDTRLQQLVSTVPLEEVEHDSMSYSAIYYRQKKDFHLRSRNPPQSILEKYNGLFHSVPLKEEAILFCPGHRLAPNSHSHRISRIPRECAQLYLHKTHMELIYGASRAPAESTRTLGLSIEVAGT